MKRQFRIKETCQWYRFEDDNTLHVRYMPTYKVQMKIGFLWITIKTFFDMFDPDFARRESEELFDKLTIN